MITVIIFGAISLIIAIVKITKTMGGNLDFSDFFIAIPITITGALAGCIVSFCIPVEKQTDHIVIPLVSIQDNTNIHGSFFLGSGQINERMKYCFYELNDDSTYKFNQVDCEKARIKYSVNGQAFEHIYYTHGKKSIWERFGIIPDKEHKYNYVFEIPAGSIQNNFKLDAQ